MEFDINKVYSAPNADKIKIGSKGYFSDVLKHLREAVEQERSNCYGEIAKIKEDFYAARFKIKNDYCYGLFYPAEEPTKKILRPYKSTDEMIAHFHKCVELTPQNDYIPNIWVIKKINGFTMQITGFGDTDSVIVDGSEMNLCQAKDLALSTLLQRV